MRGKRAKAYRKLMHQYHVNFNFREPYQVLLDSAILQDAARYKIDLIGRLAKMLDGEVKPMITTCDMRHLYGAQPKDEGLIMQAKGYERRRCNHQDLDEPLSSLECLSEVVDPKSSLTNKHRYVVASQDPRVRAHMRKIAGVPLIYISKSVVILEPMGTATEKLREREEKAKFRAGLKGRRNANANAGEKRKRDEDEDEDRAHDQNGASIAEQSTGDTRPQKKIRKGPKAPNPLSMKKPKKVPQDEPKKSRPADEKVLDTPTADTEASNPDGEPTKRKRKRKHKPKADGGGTEAQTQGDVASP